MTVTPERAAHLQTPTLRRKDWNRIEQEGKPATQALRELHEKGKLPPTTYSEVPSDRGGYGGWTAVALCGVRSASGDGANKRAARLAAADELLRMLAIGG
jgi:hypothetical protein